MAKNDCNDCLPLLPLYADGELDARAAAVVQAHLSRCSACSANLKVLSATSDAVKGERLTAPAALENNILRALRADAPKASPLFLRWIAPSLSAAALAVALALFVATPSVTDLAADEAVSAHVRSLQEQHLVDVASTDQHTVKPWFAGRIDFSPPVRDFADQGFELAGGRLDYLSHQVSAALVYRHKKHVINVFVTAAAGDDVPPHASSRRGYNMVAWRSHGLSFEAVSDLNGEDLMELCRLIAHP